MASHLAERPDGGSGIQGPEREFDDELQRLLDRVETMFTGRYDIDLDHVDIPEELSDKYIALVSVDLGPLSEAWGSVLVLREMLTKSKPPGEST